MTSTRRSRVQPGVAAGGEFATELKSESGISLGPTTHQETAAATAQRMLADALGQRPGAIDVQLRAVSACGVAAGSQSVTLTAKVQDTTLSIGFLTAPAGATSELSATVTWDAPELADYGYDTDQTSTPYDQNRSVTSLTIAAIVADVTRQARQQRAFDTAINNPQLVRSNGILRPHEVVRAEAVVVDGRTYVKITDGGRPRSRSVTLRVDDTGITGARVDTEYGPVTVTEPKELEGVLRDIDVRLTLAMGLASDTCGREHLTALLAEAYGRA